MTHEYASGGKLERIVWDAMIWGANATPPPYGAAHPSYTDRGNSDAEIECRAVVVRILSALDVPTDQQPSWLTNCSICGRVVDMREPEEGGDAHGCECSNGWACSRECALALQPPKLAEALALPEVRALLQEAREDLAAYVDEDYPPTSRAKYPDIQRRWHRDMELCRRIDAALDAAQEGEG